MTVKANTMTTLIVEDDITRRRSLEKFLHGCGASHIAINGKESIVPHSKPENLMTCELPGNHDARNGWAGISPQNPQAHRSQRNTDSEWRRDRDDYRVGRHYKH